MARLMDYDTLVLEFRQLQAAPDRYQVTMRQRGLPLDGGPFKHRATFSAIEVPALRHTYEQELLRIHRLQQRGFSPMTPPSQALFDLGRRVTAVLPPQTQRSLVRALLLARRRKRSIAIVISVHTNAQALLNVPWELLTLPLQDVADRVMHQADWVFRDSARWLVREVQGLGHNATSQLGSSLRVEAFGAQPLGVAPINLVAVHEALVAALPEAALRWYAERNTMWTLHTRLRESLPDVLHLVCHGYHHDAGQGVRNDLLLTHADGFAQRVSSFDLAPLLGQVRALKLVVLQACHAGAPQADAQRQATESLALELLGQGLPLVVAFQGEADQDAAVVFVATLYQDLQAGCSVEQAVAQGRVAVHAAGHSIDWSLPVIYRGSSQAEQGGLHTWLADQLEAGLHDPHVLRTLRAGTILGSLLLLAVAGIRWLLLPPPPPSLVESEIRTAQLFWAGFGLFAASIVAATHRATLPPSGDVRLRRVIVRQKWIGAFLGYALGGVIAWTVVAVLAFCGLWAWWPTIVQRWTIVGSLSGVLGCALLMSYMAARTQVQSARVLAQDYPELFGPSSFLVLVFGIGLLLGAPVLWSMWLAPLLFSPVPAATAAALILLGSVLLDTYKPS